MVFPVLTSVWRTLRPREQTLTLAGANHIMSTHLIGTPNLLSHRRKYRCSYDFFTSCDMLRNQVGCSLMWTLTYLKVFYPPLPLNTLLLCLHWISNHCFWSWWCLRDYCPGDKSPSLLPCFSKLLITPRKSEDCRINSKSDETGVDLGGPHPRASWLIQTSRGSERLQVTHQICDC